MEDEKHPSLGEVWVVEMHSGHGENCHVHGVYDSREAAFEDLKGQPNMAVYVDDEGHVRGRPAKERRGLGDYYRPQRWALGQPMPVQARRPAPAPSPSHT